ncbi:MAG: glycosyltransferase family 2 protein [Candidatus Babeliales bacterium]
MKLRVASLLLLVCMSIIAEQKRFVIVVPSYKNKDHYKKNIDSILDLAYEQYRVIYLDDRSPDSTGALVQNYVEQKGMAHKFTIITNTIRVLALANIYRAVYMCDDDEICLFLDGDDWFARKDVLTILNQVYNNEHEEVWMTYGNFKCSSKENWTINEDIPDDIILRNAYREYDWVTSHLRTCYAGIFKQIKLKDLLHNNGFYPVAWDLAYMFPLLEMSAGRVHFIKEVLYMYNTQNPLSDMYQKPKEQLELDKYIRKQKRYTSINGVMKQEAKVQVEQGGLVIVSNGTPDVLEQFLKQQAELINNFKHAVCVVWSAQTQEHEAYYREIMNQYDITGCHNGLFFAAFHALAQKKEKINYLFVCSDTWQGESSTNLKHAVDHLNQTKAVAMLLSKQVSFKGPQAPAAYWGSDCLAYQFKQLPKNLFDAWAYMLNVPEMVTNYLMALTWNWEFWRLKTDNSKYANQILLVGAKEII